MTKPTLLVTRALPSVALDKLRTYFELTVHPDDRVMEKSEIIDQIKDKDALLCLLTDTIDKAVLDAAPKLKVISNYAVGFNNIDIQEATRRRIPVCNTPGVLTETTADLTFALILAITRRIVEADKFTRAGRFAGWGPELLLGHDVYGKTLGIIGMGRIGEAVAKRAMGFDMKILYTGHQDKKIANTEWVPLSTLLQNADIVSLHVPLTKETQHLIGEKELKLMKKTAYLINTTRGAVVDEKALLAALKQNAIAGAGLDVYEQEPELTAGLTELDNVVLLPHIGSASIETRTKMALIAADNLIAIFEGKKPYSVANPEVLPTK